MQDKKQQLELDMEQWTGSKLGKEYVECVCCHYAYLTSMQSTCVPYHFSHVQLFASLGTVAHQAPLSMGFSREEHRSGSLYPPPRELPNPRIELASSMSPALAGRFFTTNATWETLYDEYIMQNAGLDDSQTEIKIAGRNINNLRYTYDTTLMAEREEELKSFLMRVKEESEKAA